MKIVVLHSRETDSSYFETVKELRDNVSKGEQAPMVSAHSFTDLMTEPNKYNQELPDAIRAASYLLIERCCMSTPDGQEAMEAAAQSGVFVCGFGEVPKFDPYHVSLRGEAQL